MSKRSIAGIAFLGGSIAVLVLSFALQTSANLPDANWQGYPLPPCFVDATACRGHLLGTDDIGRDMLARLAQGARITLGMSFLAAAISLAIGFGLGSLAARGGETARFLALGIADIVSSVATWPFIVGVVLMCGLQRHTVLQPVPLTVLTGFLFWPNIARMLAGSVSLREGAWPALSLAAGNWAAIILLLATVDFFGFGVQPVLASWGNMLATVQMDLLGCWWAAVEPAICIFSAVYVIRIARPLIDPRPGA